MIKNKTKRKLKKGNVALAIGVLGHAVLVILLVLKFMQSAEDFKDPIHYPEVNDDPVIQAYIDSVERGE